MLSQDPAPSPTSSPSPTPTVTPSPTPILPLGGDPQPDLTQENVEFVFNEFIEAWNDKKYVQQMKYISEDFTSVSYDDGYGEATCSNYGQGAYACYNYNTYAALKASLSERYDWIDVQISNIEIIEDNESIVVRYKQHYRSPSYSSEGTNELYFRQADRGGIEIYKEVFFRDRFSS